MPCPDVPTESELYRQRGDFNAKVAKGSQKDATVVLFHIAFRQAVGKKLAREARRTVSSRLFGANLKGEAVATFADPLRPLR
jgi:hypothetical protein